KKLEPDRMLAKFALLRWDQLQELAIRFGPPDGDGDNVRVDKPMLTSALEKLVDSRLDTKQPYIELMDNRQRSRSDLSKFLVWSVRGVPKGQSFPACFSKTDGGIQWLEAQDLNVALGSYRKRFKLADRGTLEWLNS